MTLSMTGYATRRGQRAGQAWTWDLRGVNGKGLDLRLRLPDGIDGLEPGVRAEVARAATRGNLSLTLKVEAEAGAGAAFRVNTGVLADVLRALAQVEQAAMTAGVTLAQATQAEVLAIRGVVDYAAAEADTGPLKAALLADLGPLMAEFNAARAAEGAALAAILSAQLDRIATLSAEARTAAAARAGTQAETLRTQVARVLAEGVDEARLAQELAMLAVKADVTEEVDRLDAHVAAARALLADAGPVGKKFDFLMQEFMREANTLCSKAASGGLTRIGLDLKTVIDQMREQVQNVE
ncbi:MAG: YicC/YloC family endoribonuclease [Gemmobacter sp.]